MEKPKEVKRTRAKISKILDNILELIFPEIVGRSIFYAVSIYPNFFDESYYSDVLVKHFLPFLNKGIMELLKIKGADKSLYFKYPKEYIKTGNLNPIFPHIIIKYNLLQEDRAEIIFGFTEEGVYIARTFTVDDPNFKKKIDEERPYKDFKSSISPKLALIMLNFLNLFEKRREKTILDPFVGNGTILLFALLQDFQVFGSDIDEIKVQNTIRNINWLLRDLDEPIPPLLNERIRTINIEELSENFEPNFFDGVCTEPNLGPYFLNLPYYDEIKELIDSQLEPLYNNLFRGTYKILKPNRRICIVAPLINTIDGGEMKLNINKIATEYRFKLIPMLNNQRIVNKSNQRLQFQKKYSKNIIDAKKSQVIKRKFYVFKKLG